MTTGQFPKRRETDAQAAIRVARLEARREMQEAARPLGTLRPPTDLDGAIRAVGKAGLDPALTRGRTLRSVWGKK